MKYKNTLTIIKKSKTQSGFPDAKLEDNHGKTLLNVLLHGISHELIKEYLCDKHLCYKHLCDKHLCDKHLCDKHLCDKHFCDKHLCDKHLCDKHKRITVCYKKN